MNIHKNGYFYILVNGAFKKGKCDISYSQCINEVSDIFESVDTLRSSLFNTINKFTGDYNSYLPKKIKKYHTLRSYFIYALYDGKINVIEEFNSVWECKR